MDRGLLGRYLRMRTSSARCTADAVHMRYRPYACRVGTCPLLGLPRVSVVLGVNREQDRDAHCRAHTKYNTCDMEVRRAIQRVLPLALLTLASLSHSRIAALSTAFRLDEFEITNSAGVSSRQILGSRILLQSIPSSSPDIWHHSKPSFDVDFVIIDTNSSCPLPFCTQNGQLSHCAIWNLDNNLVDFFAPEPSTAFRQSIGPCFHNGLLPLSFAATCRNSLLPPMCLGCTMRHLPLTYTLEPARPPPTQRLQALPVPLAPTVVLVPTVPTVATPPLPPPPSLATWLPHGHSNLCSHITGWRYSNLYMGDDRAFMPAFFVLWDAYGPTASASPIGVGLGCMVVGTAGPVDGACLGCDSLVTLARGPIIQSLWLRLSSSTFAICAASLGCDPLVAPPSARGPIMQSLTLWLQSLALLSLGPYMSQTAVMDPICGADANATPKPCGTLNIATALSGVAYIATESCGVTYIATTPRGALDITIKLYGVTYIATVQCGISAVTTELCGALVVATAPRGIISAVTTELCGALVVTCGISAAPLSLLMAAYASCSLRRPLVISMYLLLCWASTLGCNLARRGYTESKATGEEATCAEPPPLPSPPIPAPSPRPLDSLNDVQGHLDADALSRLFGSWMPSLPPGLGAYCLPVLMRRIEELASDLAEVGCKISDSMLMVAAERHLDGQYSDLRALMRRPYPSTFPAYANEFVELASLNAKAAASREAIQRLETSLIHAIPPSSSAHPAAIRDQLDRILAAASDWSAANNGALMHESVLIHYLDRSLPLVYAPLRMIARYVGLSTVHAHANAMIALASVDQACMQYGQPVLSSRVADACDFLLHMSFFQQSQSTSVPSLPTAPLEPPDALVMPTPLHELSIVPSPPLEPSVAPTLLLERSAVHSPSLGPSGAPSPPLELVIAPSSPLGLSVAPSLPPTLSTALPPFEFPPSLDTLTPPLQSLSLAALMIGSLLLGSGMANLALPLGSLAPRLLSSVAREPASQSHVVMWPSPMHSSRACVLLPPQLSGSQVSGLCPSDLRSSDSQLRGSTLSGLQLGDMQFSHVQFRSAELNSFQPNSLSHGLRITLAQGVCATLTNGVRAVFTIGTPSAALTDSIHVASAYRTPVASTIRTHVASANGMHVALANHLHAAPANCMQVAFADPLPVDSSCGMCMPLSNGAPMSLLRGIQQPPLRAVDCMQQPPPSISFNCMPLASTLLGLTYASSALPLLTFSLLLPSRILAYMLLGLPLLSLSVACKQLPPPLCALAYMPFASPSPLLSAARTLLLSPSLGFTYVPFASSLLRLRLACRHLPSPSLSSTCVQSPQPFRGLVCMLFASPSLLLILTCMLLPSPSLLGLTCIPFVSPSLPLHMMAHVTSKQLAGPSLCLAGVPMSQLTPNLVNTPPAAPFLPSSSFWASPSPELVNSPLLLDSMLLNTLAWSWLPLSTCGLAHIPLKCFVLADVRLRLLVVLAYPCLRTYMICAWRQLCLAPTRECACSLNKAMLQLLRSISPLTLDVLRSSVATPPRLLSTASMLFVLLCFTATFHFECVDGSGGAGLPSMYCKPLSSMRWPPVSPSALSLCLAAAPCAWPGGAGSWASGLPTLVCRLLGPSGLVPKHVNIHTRFPQLLTTMEPLLPTALMLDYLDADSMLMVTSAPVNFLLPSRYSKFDILLSQRSFIRHGGARLWNPSLLTVIQLVLAIQKAMPYTSWPLKTAVSWAALSLVMQTTIYILSMCSLVWLVPHLLPLKQFRRPLSMRHGGAWLHIPRLLLVLLALAALPVSDATCTWLDDGPTWTFSASHFSSSITDSCGHEMNLSAINAVTLADGAGTDLMNRLSSPEERSTFSHQWLVAIGTALAVVYFRYRQRGQLWRSRSQMLPRATVPCVRCHAMVARVRAEHQPNAPPSLTWAPTVSLPGPVRLPHGPPPATSLSSSPVPAANVSADGAALHLSGRQGGSGYKRVSSQSNTTSHSLRPVHVVASHKGIALHLSTESATGYERVSFVTARRVTPYRAKAPDGKLLGYFPTAVEAAARYASHVAQSQAQREASRQFIQPSLADTAVTSSGDTIRLHLNCRSPTGYKGVTLLAANRGLAKPYVARLGKRAVDYIGYYETALEAAFAIAVRSRDQYRNTQYARESAHTPLDHDASSRPLGSDLADRVDELGLNSLFPLLNQDDVGIHKLP